MKLKSQRLSKLHKFPKRCPGIRENTPNYAPFEEEWTEPRTQVI